MPWTDPRELTPEPWTVEDQFRWVSTQPSDIYQHCAKLRELAVECNHIVELGTAGGRSTRAFIAGRPKRIVSYDVNPKCVGTIMALLELEGLGDMELQFICQDSIDAEAYIEETDLLFIDTWHCYMQLAQELRLHAQRAGRYIVMHDTRSFGTVGEDGGKGIMPAIDNFLKENYQDWIIHHEDGRNNGLMVLKRAGV